MNKEQRSKTKGRKAVTEYLTAAHIEELRGIHRRREIYTRLLDEGKLRFCRSSGGRRACASCNHTHRTLCPPGHVITGVSPVEPLPMIQIDGEWLCYHCFVGQWCVATVARPGAGSPHGVTPHSQYDYDGGRFHAGEW